MVLQTIILLAFYIAVLLHDGLNVFKTGSKKEIIFNVLVYCSTFIIIFLYTIDIYLPSATVFITKITEKLYARLGLSVFIT